MGNNFDAAREELKRKVEANSGDALSLSVLGLIDAALGQNQLAIHEAKRAVEMMPACQDAVEGPLLVINMASVYALSNEPDLAFQELAISAKTPRGITYGELKLDPRWDVIRKDRRFAKLLASLAPR